MALQFSAKVSLIPDPKGVMKAYATLIINDLVEINGFRVIEGSKGTFVAPPHTKWAKTGEDGKDQYFDDVRFSDRDEKGFSDTKTLVQNTILEAYGVLLGQNLSTSRGNTATARTDDPKPTGKRPGMRAPANW
jgi:DNA-binding cell septation regulator SpoVG